jgi:hypothetical protein
VLARLEGHWLMLDNRRMAMIEDIDVRNHRPLFVISDDGVMRYQEPSPAVIAARQDSAPAMAVNFAVPVDVASRSN